MTMKFQDMAQSPKEAEESMPCPSPADAPRYPYGLCISLCEDELEKLGVDEGELEVGDIIHLHAFALVTSASESATMGGDKHCRVELQITHMSLESEDEENEDNEPYERPYF